MSFMENNRKVEGWEIWNIWVVLHKKIIVPICDESDRLVRERFNGRLNCKPEGNDELYAKYGE